MVKKNGVLQQALKVHKFKFCYIAKEDTLAECTCPQKPTESQSRLWNMGLVHTLLKAPCNKQPPTFWIICVFSMIFSHCSIKIVFK